MKTDQKAFAQRLRAALEAEGIEASPAAIERLLAREGAVSVTQQAISGWLNGKHRPKPEHIEALAAILGIEAHELEYRSHKGVRDAPARWPDQVRGHDRLAFEAFLKLPEERRRLVRELIAALGGTSKAGR
jgi:transcriptional regulator with XRE-family HTH domain